MEDYYDVADFDPNFLIADDNSFESDEYDFDVSFFLRLREVKTYIKDDEEVSDFDFVDDEENDENDNDFNNGDVSDYDFVDDEDEDYADYFGEDDEISDYDLADDQTNLYDYQNWINDRDDYDEYEDDADDIGDDDESKALDVRKFFSYFS